MQMHRNPGFSPCPLLILSTTSRNEQMVQHFFSINHHFVGGDRYNHELCEGVSEQVQIRDSGACRTTARGTLNARRAARRVSEANHPGKSTSWTPAFAGVTTLSGLYQMSEPCVLFGFPAATTFSTETAINAYAIFLSGPARIFSVFDSLPASMQIVFPCCPTITGVQVLQEIS